MKITLFLLVLLVMPIVGTASSVDSPTENETQLSELTVQLQELNRKYDLAVQGMASGSTGVGVAAGVVVLLILAAAITFGIKGSSFISGGSLAFSIVAILTALVTYFAFVFDREADLRAEISETNRTIQFVTKKCD